MVTDPVILQSIVNDLVLDRPETDTRLDRLAMAAMQGLVANTKHYSDVVTWAEDNEREDEYCRRVAESAYDIAEAMIREREKRLLKSGTIEGDKSP